MGRYFNVDPNVERNLSWAGREIRALLVNEYTTITRWCEVVEEEYGIRAGYAREYTVKWGDKVPRLRVIVTSPDRGSGMGDLTVLEANEVMVSVALLSAGYPNERTDKVIKVLQKIQPRFKILKGKSLDKLVERMNNS